MGLAQTPLANARCGRFQLKPLKIGTRVKVKRLWAYLPTPHPTEKLFRDVYERLRRGGENREMHTGQFASCTEIRVGRGGYMRPPIPS
ncbi:MAG: hypothetical protein HC897_11705 [Thermoanaerobaculia bacterium]|nr:hypothetical protein [Thermoanaerobaculia bacterium]